MQKLFFVPVGCTKHLTIFAVDVAEAIAKADLLLWIQFSDDPIIAKEVKQINEVEGVSQSATPH